MTKTMIAAFSVLFVTTLPLYGQSIPYDKQLHIAAGSAVYAASRATGLSRQQSVTMCAAVGVAKEAYDATGRGTVEFMDVVATVAPCLIASIVGKTVETRRRARVNVSRDAMRDLSNFQRTLRN